ncbi:mediator of RNA polymerase II transcription subunit 16 isoform X1 [Aethina tumida]|uniref:mediator of RNA polymerase II transcription subunit 16 isoform X1 n=1 Tax=Aethina tumida TaxID=116153 RepID=UPI00096B2318|nr:mediator of RNA polymerase II transcription subunit 16 isoform X1 [Aethina tumida]
MDHIFTISKKPVKSVNSSKQNIFNKLEKSIVCSISSTNVVAFSTESNLEEGNALCWSSNVYVADLNSPWQVHKILGNSSPVTVLQWDFTGELLLIGDENGNVRIYKTKEHILNEWSLVLQTTLQGEHILSAAFFHSGKRVCLNSEKKDNISYVDKFQQVKFACSVKQFGGRPATGALLLTTTGMLAAVLLPQTTSQTPMIIATESLGHTRIFVKTADICYGKNGHFLIAVSSGNPVMPIQCYKVSVKKNDDKCEIQSECLLSFYLFEAPKEAIMDQLTRDKRCTVNQIKWIMREDADSLVVSASSDKLSCLQVWELREKAVPVHKSLGNSDSPQFYTTVLWQYQCHFQYNSKVTSLSTSKLSLVNSLSSGYIVVTYADNTIHCLCRDSLKPIANTKLSMMPRYLEESNAKYQKIDTKISNIDMSWLGNILLIVDSDDSLHLFRLPPQIDSSQPLSVPYCTTILEYCLVTGLDWLDLLLVLRPGLLDALCDRLSESFNRQPSSLQQFYYVQYLCIKISLYRLTAQGQNKASDLSNFLMLHSISTAFKSLLRPSEMNSHEKSPADSLATVIAEGQSDVDKVLMHLEAKEFTVEPSTLQSLQQLIQWVADLALNLLIKLPDSRPSPGKSYELLRDVKALNMLREMLVLIRIWGLLRPACLPVFIKSDGTLDVLALVFRLLSRLVQNVNEPDDALIDECCLLPSQVQIQPLQQTSNKIALACPQLSQQILPLQLEFNNEPECLASSNDIHTGQTVDSIRHLYLGRTPRMIKQCVRCGSAAGTVPVTRTAAIRAWDQRWLRSCQCGGLWRMQVYT